MRPIAPMLLFAATVALTAAPLSGGAWADPRERLHNRPVVLERSRAHDRGRPSRHFLRRGRLHRGADVQGIVTLGPEALSEGGAARAPMLARRAFDAHRKGGIFAPRSETTVVIRPHLIRRHRLGGEVAIEPRLIIGHEGHGLYAPGSALFGGKTRAPGLAPGRRGSFSGFHPHNILVRGRRR